MLHSRKNVGNGEANNNTRDKNEESRKADELAEDEVILYLLHAGTTSRRSTACSVISEASKQQVPDCVRHPEGVN